MKLRGFKAIAEHLEKAIGFEVSIPTVQRSARHPTDPLPVRRMRLSGSRRPVVVADPRQVDAWARRRESA